MQLKNETVQNGKPKKFYIYLISDKWNSKGGRPCGDPLNKKIYSFTGGDKPRPYKKNSILS